MHATRILGRSLVDSFCRYVAPMVFPGGDYCPDQADVAPSSLNRFRQALAAIGRGAMVEARTLLESTLADQPAFVAARLILAAVLSDTGHRHRAAEVLDTVLLDCLDDGRIWFLAGQLAERSGEIERSIQCYNEAVARPGRSACDAAERLAAIYLATEDYPRARDSLQWLINARPDEFAVRLELAGVLAHLGDTDAAVRAYQNAILMDPDDCEARQDYAATLEAQGRHSEALAELRLVLDEHPDFADVQIRAARLSGGLGDLRGALRHVDAALKTNPRYLEAIVLKGVILTEQGEPHAAIATFQRAIQVNEEYTTAYAGLALALERAGRHKESAETMELARKIAPGSEQIYARLSKLGVQAALSRRDERPGHPQAAGRRGPPLGAGRNAPDGAGEAGTPQAKELDHDEMMRRQLDVHSRAIRKNPNYADLRYYYGLLLSSLGRTDEALEQYRAAVDVNPRYVEALVRLALGCWQLNRPDEALHALKKAHALTPAEVDVYYRFGLVWADRGLWPLTVEALSKAVQTASPDAPHGAILAAVQNLGIMADRSRDYLSSLNLLDARDRPVDQPLPQKNIRHRLR